jgi:hypothetical protein
MLDKVIREGDLITKWDGTEVLLVLRLRGREEIGGEAFEYFDVLWDGEVVEVNDWFLDGFMTRYVDHVDPVLSRPGGGP